MIKEISSKYNPSEVEDKWYEYWLDNNFFHSEPDEREPYTIVIPPPNVTGILHMGHMLNNTIQDILVRRARMAGKNACWVPGTDHASIATEAKVVTKLSEQGVKKSDLSREKFLEHAWEWTHKHGGIILEQLKKLGCSCDWDRTAFTMDEIRSESVIKVFCDLYNKGLIYRGVRMVNWDPQALTALSDEEVNHKEQQGKLYYLRYRVVDADNTNKTLTEPEIDRENKGKKQTDRKIAFISIDNEKGIKKVMICKNTTGFSLFEFDTKLDCNCISDLFFEKLENAEQYCNEKYNIQIQDWFAISNQQDFCNVDYIMPVKIKGRETGKPQFDNWEIQINGKWEEFLPPYDENLNAMTVNERLYRSGLVDEYEKAVINNKEKAEKILAALEIDNNSIKKILAASPSQNAVAVTTLPEIVLQITETTLAEFQTQLIDFDKEKLEKINAALKNLVEKTIAETLSK